MTRLFNYDNLFDTPKILKLALNNGGTRTQYLSSTEIDLLSDFKEVKNNTRYDPNKVIIQESGDYRVRIKLTFTDTADTVDLILYKNGNSTVIGKAKKYAGSAILDYDDVITELKKNDKMRVVVKNNGSSAKVLEDDKFFSYIIIEKV